MKIDGKGLREAEVQQAINNFVEEKIRGIAFKLPAVMEKIRQTEREIKELEKSEEAFILECVRGMDKEPCKCVLKVIKEKFPDMTA